jgi:uncharacterized membrane protein YjfL (UPF0719 family)
MNTMEQVAQNALASVVFAVVGFILLFAAYRMIDWLTPRDLDHEIIVSGRIAPAVLAGAVVVALALIVARTIL